MPSGQRCVAIALLLGSAAAPMGAQNAGLPRRDNPALFLEKAYFAPFSPIGRGYLFEGQPSAHYFLTNGFNDREWTRTGGLKWAPPVSMTFVVRMVDTTSQPVRTPSYQIRPVYVQLVHISGENLRNREAFVLYGIGGGITHYSNGQAGCTFEGFVRASPSRDAPCLVHEPELAGRHVTNVVDGDFSTTFFSLALHRRTGRLRIESGAPEGVVHFQHTLGTEVQVHPIDMKPGGMNGPQSLDYGQHQAGVSYEGEWRPCELPPSRGLCGVTRLALGGAYRFAREGGRSRRFASAELSYLFDRARTVGVFARLTQGSDYYNIRYQRTGPLLFAGAMWDVGRLDVYRRTPIR